jgi:DNA polymerase-3 subunit epsilon
MPIEIGSIENGYIFLLEALIQDDPGGQASVLITALPLQQPTTEENVIEFTFPWHKTTSFPSEATLIKPEWVQESAAALECARLSELIHGSRLISFDACSICDTYLLPLFAAHNAEPPQFSYISLRDLAQRLLDPRLEACRSLEALNLFCGLEKLEQKEPQAAVFNLASILNEVLWPRLAERQLTDWEHIASFAASPWFPSRFAFGKYKGRHVQEATEDPELKAWLEGLSQSNNSQSAVMARWYLDQLSSSAPDWSGLIAYTSPEVVELKARIAAVREHLAELEAEYTEEHQAVAVVESQLFLLLRPSYEKRDQLQLRIDYRRRFLDALLSEGEEQAAKVAEAHQQASQESERAYEDASREATDTSKLNPEEQQELRSIYRRLAALYHPDRYALDPAKQAVYETLMKLINSARDSGWIDRLREIASDPNGFLLSQGFAELDLREDSEINKLLKLVEKLNEKIQQTQDSLNQLRQSSGFELWQLSLKDPNFINTIASDQIKDLQAEIVKLEAEAVALAVEIEQLTETPDPFEAHAAND